MVDTLGWGAQGPRLDTRQQVFSYFIKILVFSLYFASITSFIVMLMLDYPLRVNLKKVESGYSKFSMLLPNVQSPRLSRLVWNRRLGKIDLGNLTISFASGFLMELL